MSGGYAPRGLFCYYGGHRSEGVRGGKACTPNDEIGKDTEIKEAQDGRRLKGD